MSLSCHSCSQIWGCDSGSYGHGKPVVATAVGGIKEMIIDGVSSFGVPPGNSEP